MSRLPNPGSDDGQWGAILNDFLGQSLDSGGLLKPTSVGTVQLQDGSVTASKLSASGPNTGQVLSYNGSALNWVTPSSSGSVPDADASTKGLVQLAGDLAGTAAAPSVNKIKGVSLSATAPTNGQVLSYNGSSATWTTLSSSGGVTSVAGKTGVVSLVESDVTNLTTDLASKATDSAVVHNSGNETITGTKNFTGTLQSGGQAVVATNDARLSDSRVPTNGSVTVAKLSAGAATANQVLSFDGINLAWTTQTSSGNVSDATTSVKGIIQLAGDLTGTAGSPTVAKVNGISVTGTPSVGQVLTANSTSAAAWATPSAGGVTSVAGKTGVVSLVESDVTNLTTDLASKATDSAVVHNSGNETVAGVKTFSSSPIVPTPTTATQAATKAYVDAAASAGASNATTTSPGLVQLAGDLGGTATAPTIAANAIVNAKIADNTIAEPKLAISNSPSTNQVLSWNGSSLAWATPASGGGGGGRTVTAVKTSAYTAAAGEYVIVNSTGAGFTVTLPTGQASGTCVSLKSISTNSNAVSIMPGGSDHIEDNGNYDGVSVSLNSGQTDMDFIYDGVSRWYRVG